MHHHSVSRAHHHNRDWSSVSLKAQTTDVQHKQSIPQRPKPAVTLLSLIICILTSNGQIPSPSSLLLSSGFGVIGASQLYFLEPNAAYYRYELKCPLSLIRWPVRGRYRQPLWKLWCWPWRRMTLGGHILLNYFIRWVGVRMNCLCKPLNPFFPPMFSLLAFRLFASVFIANDFQTYIPFMLQLGSCFEYRPLALFCKLMSRWIKVSVLLGNSFRPSR